MIGNAHINFAPKFILEYAEQFPKLRFNMLSPSDVPSFLEGKADVICLSAQAQLSNCIMLPRGRMIFVPVATPQYLKEHGPINHPDDLLHHRVFSNLYPNSFSLNSNYQLTKKGQSCSFQAIDTIRYSNVEMTRRSVLEHAGIAPCMPLFFVIDDLECRYWEDGIGQVTKIMWFARMMIGKFVKFECFQIGGHKNSVITRKSVKLV